MAQSPRLSRGRRRRDETYLVATKGGGEKGEGLGDLGVENDNVESGRHGKESVAVVVGQVLKKDENLVVDGNVKYG